MEKITPYEKLSKKEKRKVDQARRQTWGELNPITGQPPTAETKPEIGSVSITNQFRDFYLHRCYFCAIIVPNERRYLLCKNPK